MAKLLELDRSAGESWEEAFDRMLARPTAPSPPPGPHWERFKRDPQWKTDRWICRADKPGKAS